MSNKEIYDDPIWEYLLVTKLKPYLPAVRRWWDNYENMNILSTGTAEIRYDDIEMPSGLFMRMTSTAARSPIKNIQAFPFVPVGYLQITGVPGGVNRMVERTCSNNKLVIDEFTIIEKHNLPSTYQKGMILCIIPTDKLVNKERMGKYIFLTALECINLAQGKVPESVQAKCYTYLQ